MSDKNGFEVTMEDFLEVVSDSRDAGYDYLDVRLINKGYPFPRLILHYTPWMETDPPDHDDEEGKVVTLDL